MLNPRVVAIGIISLTLVATAAICGELIVRRHCTKPGCLDGIPSANYQYGARSGSAMRTSLTAQLLQIAGPGVAPRSDLTARGNERRVRTESTDVTDDSCGVNRTTSRRETVTRDTARHVDEEAERRERRIRIYQLDRAKLQVDHCAISRVAFQLDEQGTWALSLRADQNAPQPAVAEGASRPAQLVTSHIKRNQFAIKVRCYGAYTTKESQADETSGKPVLFQIEPAEFWVENGQPLDFHKQRTDDRARKYFELVDRVEIEFYYR